MEEMKMRQKFENLVVSDELMKFQMKKQSKKI